MMCADRSLRVSAAVLKRVEFEQNEVFSYSSRRQAADSRAFSTRRLSAENRRKILEDRTHRHVEERLVNRFNMCCVCTHFFTGIPPSAVCCRDSLVYLCRTEQIHASHHMCAYARTRTHTHAHIRARTHTHIRARMHALTHTHIMIVS